MVGHVGGWLFQMAILVVTLTVGALTLGAIPARADSPTLVYEFNVGGLEVADVEVDIDIGNDGYFVATDLRTQGLAKFLTGFMADSTSRGMMHGEGFRPHSHQTRSAWRGEDRHVDMRYRSGVAPRATVVPSPDEDEREVVDPAETVGSVDPLSGVLTLLANAGERKLQEPVKIFDGRRLYTLSVLSVEPRTVESAAYTGAGLAVRLLYERLGGRFKDGGVKKGRGTSEAVLHVVPGKVFGLKVPVPVRLEADTKGYGMIVALLRQVRTDRLSAEDETPQSATCGAVDSKDIC